LDLSASRPSFVSTRAARGLSAIVLGEKGGEPMFSSGSWTLGRFRGAPIRVHWSVLVGIFVFSGFRFDPIAWLAVVVMILLHELGHAALIHHFGYPVIAVEAHGFGGHCEWAGDPTRAEQAAVAWGGVLAQAALWIVASLVLLVIGEPSAPSVATVLSVFTTTNAYSILLNLMPIPPLDGSKAWELLPLWWSGRSELRDYLRRRDADKQRVNRERAAEKRRSASREATEKELRDLEEREKEEAPIPDTLKETFERLAKEAAEARAKKRDRE
jgi:stage IV sporulation protein FB